MVPVVVSAGLAVGVFCGLLFGLGTGKHNASAETKVSNGAKRADEPATMDPSISTVKPPEKTAPKTGSATGSAIAANPGSAGSNAGAAGSGAAGSGAAGSGAAGATFGSAEPAAKTTKLVIEIKPDIIAQFAKISVDGQDITGTTAEIQLDPGTTKKKVKVLVKAPGYKNAEQEIEVEGPTNKLNFELTKSSRTPEPTAGGDGGGTPHNGGNTGGNTGTGGTGGKATGGGKGSGGKGKGKGSGLIDI